MTKATNVRGPDPLRHGLAVPVLKLSLQIGLGLRPQPRVGVVSMVVGKAVIIRHLVPQAFKVLDLLVDHLTQHDLGDLTINLREELLP